MALLNQSNFFKQKQKVTSLLEIIILILVSALNAPGGKKTYEYLPCQMSLKRLRKPRDPNKTYEYIPS